MFRPLDITDFPVAGNRTKTRSLKPDDRPQSSSIFVAADRIVQILGIMAILLVLSSITIQLTDYATGYSSVLVHKMVKLLNIDLELNVPTFFSVLLLLFSSMLLATVTFLRKETKSPYIVHWGVLTLGFLFMAFDEAFAIHERLIEPFRTILGEENLGVLYFAWVVPAILLVFFLSIAFFRFVLSLPPNVRRLFILAGSLYLGAALGLELLEGRHVEIFGKENLFYISLATTEETLEMAGVIVFIKALLTYLREICESIQFRFDNVENEL